MREHILRPVMTGLVAALCLATARGADWPQYRGPNQDGISAQSIRVPWGEDGPRTVWRVPVNTGFSSLSVTRDRVFTQVVRPGEPPREICLALDAKTGKELWTADVGIGTGYSGGGPGDGPRSTPTVSDGIVYVLTPAIVIHALNERTGEGIWSRDVIKEHAGRNIGWNSAASPVVDGKLVFVGGGGPGESLLALDKKTGAVVWKGFDEMITHATPLAATIHGQRQIIFFLQSGLLSVDVTDGKELWRFPFQYSVSSAITPVVSGDIVYCSAGYGVGGGACRIKKDGDRFIAEALWAVPGNKDVANHWSTPVCKDGHLYGMFSFKQFNSGPLKCVDLATGDVKWSQDGFGQGNVILVDDKLLALGDQGQLVVVEAVPEAYREVCRTQAVKGKCWSTPAFSDGRIYIRSTEEATCLAP